MWKVIYKVESGDKIFTNEKSVKSMADWSLFNNAVHSGAAWVVEVRDPRGRKHNVRRSMYL